MRPTRRVGILSRYRTLRARERALSDARAALCQHVEGCESCSSAEAEIEAMRSVQPALFDLLLMSMIERSMCADGLRLRVGVRSVIAAL